MKKIIFLSLLAAAVAMPAAVASVDAFAKDEATTTTTTTTAPAATHDTAAPAAGAMKKELKDGTWAQIEGDSVKVSKDGGKTWMAAPDGTHEFKDGSKSTTKGGKLVH